MVSLLHGPPEPAFLAQGGSVYVEELLGTYPIFCVCFCLFPETQPISGSYFNHLLQMTYLRLMRNLFSSN